MIRMDPKKGMVRISYTCRCGAAIVHKGELPGRTIELMPGKPLTMNFERSCKCGCFASFMVELPIEQVG